MSMRTGLFLVAAVGLIGMSGASGSAEDAREPDDLGLIIQRLEQQDRQAREDGLVLESFKVEQPPNDPRRKSMKLSVGEVGGTDNPNPFEEDRPSYLLDPMTPIETPPVGLNLKLQF